MGIAVNVCAPLDATPADIARMGAAHFNVLMYPETGRNRRAASGKDAGPALHQGRPDRHPCHPRFPGRGRRAHRPAACRPRPACASPGMRPSVDSTYLTGKRVYIFGDGTHAIAAARIAAKEIGFEVVGLGCYNREQARPLRAAAKAYGVEAADHRRLSGGRGRDCRACSPN